MPEQGGEGTVGAERYGVSGLVGAGRCGTQDGEDGAGGGVEDGAAGGEAAGPERFGAFGADDEFEAAAGGAEDTGLAPAVGGDAHIGAGREGVPGGERQGPYAEALGADEGEAALGQGCDGLRSGEPAPVAGGAQEDMAEPVDCFVAGDHRPVVVGEETGAPRPSRRIADPYQRRQFPAFHGTDGRSPLITGKTTEGNTPPFHAPFHSGRLSERVIIRRVPDRLAQGEVGGETRWGGHAYVPAPP
ncbi:hypothetical protein [Streptomyces sp. CBMA370]|uniref:hypothetical protein n=1 Tax=Streptomyces sp. CBMA370 TaxID=1930278 RepID=UPI001661DB42